MIVKSVFWSRLIKSTTGSVLPMAAAAILLSAAMIGAAVDMSRAYSVRSRLQAACDAGILAGRKAMQSGSYGTAEKAFANKYFLSNFDETNESSKSTSFTSDVNKTDGNSLDASASTVLNTTVVKMIGVNNISISVSCNSKLEMGDNDIMMVPDTTGSMNRTAAGLGPLPGQTTRLQDLRAAAKSFYDALAVAAKGSKARIRYGFVPFSSTVNVGKLLYAANTGYLASNYTVQTRGWYKWSGYQPAGTSTATTAETAGGWVNIGAPYSNLAACTAALPASSNWANSGAPSSPNTETWATNPADGSITSTKLTSQQKQTRYEWGCTRSGVSYVSRVREWLRFNQTYTITKNSPIYLTSATQPYDGLLYLQRTYDAGPYLAGNNVTTITGMTSDSKPLAVTSTWQGCIEERQTTPAASFVFDSGAKRITPTTALDLDIDSAPTTSDDTTKWKPLWPEVAYTRSSAGASNSGAIAASACPSAAQLFAEMDKDAFGKYVGSLTANGFTYPDVGLMWGARLSSPTGIWSSSVNDATGSSGSVTRHMIFMTDGDVEPNLTTQSAYGIESLDLRISGTGVATDQYNRHRSRFLAVCEAIKGRGIRLWAISFATTLTADLTTCASPDSVYTAKDAAQLNAAFSGIAKKISELRVTK